MKLGILAKDSALRNPATMKAMAEVMITESENVVHEAIGRDAPVMKARALLQVATTDAIMKWLVGEINAGTDMPTILHILATAMAPYLALVTSQVTTSDHVKEVATVAGADLIHAIKNCMAGIPKKI